MVQIFIPRFEPAAVICSWSWNMVQRLSPLFEGTWCRDSLCSWKKHGAETFLALWRNLVQRLSLLLKKTWCRDFPRSLNETWCRDSLCSWKKHGAETFLALWMKPVVETLSAPWMKPVAGALPVPSHETRSKGSLLSFNETWCRDSLRSFNETCCRDSLRSVNEPWQRLIWRKKNDTGVNSTPRNRRRVTFTYTMPPLFYCLYFGHWNVYFCVPIHAGCPMSMSRSITMTMSKT